MSHNSAELDRSILACFGDGVLAFDTECRYIAWNPSMEKISGMKAQEVLGQNAFRLFPFLKEIGEDNFFYAALAGHSVLAEKRAFTVPNSGHSGFFEAHYSPLRGADGKISGGVAIVRDITERMQAEQKQTEIQAAKKGEEHFRILVDGLPHIVWTADANGRNQFTNRFGLDFVGLHEGNNDFEKWTPVIHPDDLPQVSQAWEQSLNRNEPFENEQRMKRASDGSFRWILVRAFPIKDQHGRTIQWIGAATDIHEHLTASKRSIQLQSITAALSSAVTPAQVAHIILSQGLSALGARNGVMCLLSNDRETLEVIAHQGYSEAIAKDWKWIPMSAQISLTDAIRHQRSIYVESIETAKQKYPTIVNAMEASGESSFVALPLVIENNAIGSLRISFQESVVFDEEHERFMLTLAGLCSQALARSRIYELERVARASAESANAAKSSFLASVSHEIRTPLSAIVGYADLISNSKIPPEKRQSFVDGIERNSRALTRLIDDILDLSKIEAGRLSLVNAEMDLESFLKDLAEPLRQEANRKGIDFKFEQKKGTPAKIVSDAFRLRQILLNICGNAIKFTDSGSVKLTVEFHPHESSRPEYLAFVVEDTGIGLKQEAHELLFQPFVQGHPARKLGGTGLGLVISRNLARMLGGDVTIASSVPDKGSVFEIRIAPFRKSSATVSSEETPEIKLNCLSGRRILIVDDAPDIRVILADFITQQGAEIDSAENGEEALGQVLKKAYDVIIMDLEMPVMNGLVATSQLRCAGFTNPIIAITANPLADYRASIHAGFDAHLIKPIDKRKLLQTIFRLLSDRAPAL
jgi:PAS domain S-box-containing protein